MPSGLITMFVPCSIFSKNCSACYGKELLVRRFPGALFGEEGEGNDVCPLNPNKHVKSGRQEGLHEVKPDIPPAVTSAPYNYDSSDNTPLEEMSGILESSLGNDRSGVVKYNQLYICDISKLKRSSCDLIIVKKFQVMILKYNIIMTEVLDGGSYWDKLMS